MLLLLIMEHGMFDLLLHNLTCVLYFIEVTSVLCVLVFVVV